MKPLTQATAQLLAPIALSSADRLDVHLNKDSTRFVCDIYQRAQMGSPKQAQQLISQCGKYVASKMWDEEEITLEHYRNVYRQIRDEKYDEARASIDEILKSELDYYCQGRLKQAHQALNTDVQKIQPSYAARRVFPSRIPERRRLTGLEQWEFAATDYTAWIINAVWPDDQVIWEPEAKIFYEYLLLTGKQQEKNAEIYAAFKNHREVPIHGHTFHEEHPLSPYQQVALCNSIRSEGYGLFMEQGTGKTPIPIATICNEAARRKDQSRMYRAIIVAPKNVRMNWESEFHKFSTLPGKATVLRGGELKRTKQLLDALVEEDGEEFTAVICSYETLARSWNVIGKIEWDLAVLDESHYIKSARTQRYKYAVKLRDVSNKRLCLTGTPITNTALDLYTQWEFMGKGWSGFNSWNNFKQFYGVFKPNGDGYQKLVGMQNLPFMQERLARQSFLISKKEALPDLPDKVYDIVECEMTPRQREVYEQVAKHLAAEIEAEIEGAKNKSLVVTNILVKLLRLAQITSGFIVWDAKYTDDGETVEESSIEDIAGGNPKLEALLEIAKEKQPGQKTIIWATFVHDIKNIAATLRNAGYKCVTYYGATSDDDRQEAERAFNYDDDCNWFIGNPGAGGTGLNLIGYPPGQTNYKTNCDHVIYYSQDWSMVKRAQSEDRAHRRGTRQNVRVTDLCIPHTIDEEIRARVVGKRKNALEISDIRSILNNVLNADLDS